VGRARRLDECDRRADFQHATGPNEFLRVVGRRLTARNSRRHDDFQVELARRQHDRPARAGRRLVEQRHQGHAEPERRHPRRLARGSDLARIDQRRAAHLHDDRSDGAPVLHPDARSPVPRRDRLAADGLQPAAAPGVLPGRRHGRAAGAEHRDVVANPARSARPCVHGNLGRHRRVQLLEPVHLRTTLLNE